MGTFYSDEQIEEAIAALESYSPGVWERMKRMVSTSEPLTEAQEKEQSIIVRALSVVLPNVSFVARAENKNEARARLSIDLGDAVRAAVASASGRS